MAGENQTTEVVFIDFQTDLSGLESATDILQKTGQLDKQTADAFKKTNAEISKRAAVVNSAAKATVDANKKEMVSIEEVHTLMQKMLEDFAVGLQEGVIDGLKEAGFEFDELGNVVSRNGKKIGDATQSAKARLREMKAELVEMKIRGEDGTQAFRELAQAAGELEDNIGDAANEVRAFASDTSTLDGVISAATGVAGAFAVAQGTAALFGDEGEELQETLLKVNSAMAILQGLQAAYNVLQKDSAAVVALSTFAQKVYNLVVGESIGLLKAFRVALALTGVGVFVVAITLLVEWLGKSSKAIQQNIKDLNRLNDEMQRDTENLNRYIGEIQRAGEERIASLKAQGATDKQIRAETLNSLKEEQQGVRELEQSYRSQYNSALTLLQDVAGQRRKFNQEEVEAAEEVVKNFEAMTDRRKQLSTELRVQSTQDAEQTRREELESIAASLEARLAGARKNSTQELALSKQLARARADVEANEAGQDAAQQKLIRANLLKQLRELDLAYARVRQEDRIAALEASLAQEERASRAINERVSQTEIDLQKQLITERARLELMEQGLTEGQRLRIIQQSLQAQAELQRSFNQTVSRETIEDFISRNNRQLQALNINDAERLRLTEENIIAQAQIEIDAAQGLSDKIKEIEAKRDADVREARRASIEQELQYELDIATARDGVLRRANERVAQSDRSTLTQRIAAINQIAVLDIAAINKKQDALEEQLNKGLISQKDYNLRYQQLKDEELAITERTEIQKADLTRRSNEQRIAIALQVAQQIVDIVQQASQQEFDYQQSLIDQQRQRVEELKEAGAITEKEAERRQKRIDLEERRIRAEQAKREKEYAIYKAILAIPQAYLQGIAQGGPILGAIYAALAAAQAAIIASAKVPKFGVGKHNQYEGPAEIGHGTGEILQTDQGMQYVKKRSLVWLNKNDTVFSPTETQRLMAKPSLQVAKYATVNNNGNTNNFSIDYRKLGVEVGKNIPKTGFNFDADGFAMYVQGQYSFDKYLGQRRGYA